MTDGGEEQLSLRFTVLVATALPYVFYTSSDLVMHKGMEY